MMEHSAQQLSLGGLVETLGSTLIRPLTGPIGLERLVSIPVVYDPLDELPDVPGGILLVAGMHATSDGLADVISGAAGAGYCAVAIKLRGSEPAALVAAAEAASIAVLSVVDDAPWTHLGSLITAVLRSRSIADPALDSASGDLFILANAVATALGGAVAIEDLDRTVLAYSTLEHHPIDEVRRNGILARQVPDLAKHNDQYRQVMRAEGIVHFAYDPLDDELPRCAAAVRAGKEQLGSIWAIENAGPIGQEAEAALREATRLAAVQILHSRSSVNLERQVRSEWLRSAFDGSGSVRSTAARFGLVSDTPSVVVAFMLPADQTVSAQPLIRQLVAVVEQYCAAFRANVSCVSIGPVAYVLFPAVRDTASPLRLAHGAVAAVEARLGHSPYAAISSPRLGTEALPELRDEVDEILSVISGADDLPHVASAGDVHAPRMLLHIERSLSGNPLLRNAGVQELLDHDASHDTQYRVSLCAYFAALGDFAVAAKVLHVHPNTLRYRLKRAETLFGLRLSRPDDRLALWLQLRLAS
jgi:hypothetical protein